MAEWLLRDLCLKHNSSAKIKIMSAGTGAVDGWPASENTLKILKSQGIDASSHKSRLLTADLIQWADMAIAMTSSHKSAISRLAAELPKKPEIWLLSEFADENDQIIDPFGGGENIYADCFSQMKKYVYSLYDIITGKI